MENHANLAKTTTPALVEEKQDSNAKNTETGNKKEAPLPLLKGTNFIIMTSSCEI